jgi:hypothetical protein
MTSSTMQILRFARLPLRFRPWHPDHARLIASDVLGTARQPELTDREHLVGVIDWLCRAQDVRRTHPDRGGVSAGWSFEDGWLPSYPETSGYIVETFLAAARALDRADLVRRAHDILDWELAIQQSDGAYPGHFGEPGSHPVIFNTGQIMHGMIAGYSQLGRTECLDSAVRAGWWLARHQEPDGSWRRFEHNGIPHVYNTRGTWALLATGLLSAEPKLVACARANLRWAMSQQRENGWFESNAFATGRDPFTHTIAYAIRGLLECGVLLQDNGCLEAARRAAAAVGGAMRADGWIAGTLDANWHSRVRYACLTGIAQMALCWMRLAQACGDEQFRDFARRGVGYVKRQQRLEHRDSRVRGAIAGSSPIWGRYSMFEFPNWAAKFFADALMMQMTGAPIPSVEIRASADRSALVHV